MAEDKLSCFTKLVYAFPRGTTMAMALLLQTSIRSLLYVEAFGMSPNSMATSISVVKSLDLLIGFAVGTYSDRCTSRYGRRKPFIAAGFPIWVAVMLVLFNPPSSMAAGNDQIDFVKADCLGDIEFGSLNETQLKSALTNCTSLGLVPTYDSETNFETPEAGIELTVYFTIFYFLFYSVGYSVTTIPYDALGMELTKDYNERSSLFGYKAFLQFSGYLFMGALLVVFAGIYPASVQDQVFPISIIFAVVVTVSFILLLGVLKERNGSSSVSSGEEQEDIDAEQARAEEKEKPLIPTILPLLYNKPYINYLWMKVPLAIASLIPVSLLPYLLKVVMRDENANGTQGVVTIVVVVSAILACPITIWAAKRYGKTAVMITMCGVQSLAMFVLTFIDLDFFSINILAVFVGVGFIGTAIIPDALLADIIDYDELHTGRRSEGAYTVIETNLQQFVEIPAGVLPLLIFGWVSYEPNGGCKCGCGVECASKYLRWDCPNDIGYAYQTGSGGDKSNPSAMRLLFGDPGRTAPCTKQNSHVELAIRAVALLLPALCYALAMWPVWRTPITSERHGAIIANIARRGRRMAAWRKMRSLEGDAKTGAGAGAGAGAQAPQEQGGGSDANEAVEEVAHTMHAAAAGSALPSHAIAAALSPSLSPHNGAHAHAHAHAVAAAGAPEGDGEDDAGGLMDPLTAKPVEMSHIFGRPGSASASSSSGSGSSGEAGATDSSRYFWGYLISEIEVSMKLHGHAATEKATELSEADVAAGLATIRRVLVLRLVAWAVFFAGDIIIMASVAAVSSEDTGSSVVAIGSLCLSVLLVLMPWDYYKLRYYDSLANQPRVGSDRPILQVLYENACKAAIRDKNPSSDSVQGLQIQPVKKPIPSNAALTVRMNENAAL